MTAPSIPPVIGAPQHKALKYSLTRADILRWQLHTIIRNGVLITFGVIISLFSAWNDLRAPELAAHSTGYKILFMIIVTVLMFSVVGLGTMLLLVCMVIFKKFRGFLGGHELEIRDDGLVERTSVNESLHRWSGFHKVARTSRYLYIYVTDHNVHIVPRRCFASEQEQQAFQDELERHIKAAR